MKRIIVVGSGIIGASIAWHLTVAGAAVTVVDEGEPGGQATRNSWAWINASWGNSEPYFRLRVSAMQAWRRLGSTVPGLHVNWCGGLIFDLEPAALDAHARERAAWGHPIRRVTRADIAAIEPNLSAAPEHAYHVAEEGMVEPLAAATALLADAVAHGARVMGRTPIKWLAEDNGAVIGVMTDDGVIHADEVVVAAGVGTPRLLDTVGIALKIDAPAGLLSHSKPAPALLNGLVMAPGLHMRQTAEGRIVAGTDFAGADPEGDAEGLAAGLQDRVRSMLKGAEALDLDFHTVGYRPTPADGFPAVGRPGARAGLYVAVTHSGITLAPAIGQFAADELLEDRRDRLLGPFHPDRAALT